ncbi:hypothetical protein WJX72_003006 [[Myrmecia] bisecta]|uniref:Transposase n=1 Tax=[Myrmecia] bisecta TaxID=41462 RepID=A0AAW1PXG4_9CHLO
MRAPLTAALSSETTCSRSLLISQPAITDSEDTPPAKNMVSKKIRIYPNAQQVAVFRSCLGASRYFYNKANATVKRKIQDANEARKVELQDLSAAGCVHEFKKGKREGERCCGALEDGAYFCKRHEGSSLGVKYDFLSLPSLRPLVMEADREVGPAEAWQKEVPYDTRQLAIKSLLGAYKSSFALKRNGHIQCFDIKFKTKKAPQQEFQVDHRALDLGKMEVFRKRLKGKAKLRLRARDRIKVPSSKSDVVFFFRKPNRWYICVPVKDAPKPEPIYDSAAYNSVFLDPGVRTFQTFYSPDGVCGKIGAGFATNIIDPLYARIDLLTSVATERRGRTKRNLRLRCFGLRNKIRDSVDDMHRKTCRLLCAMFKDIYIPSFETQDMVSRTGDRKIVNVTARRMMTLAHYRFRQRLLLYAAARDVRVTVVSEGFTTKTCGHCGCVQDVGGSEVFRCHDCGLVADRDYHAARNVCLRTCEAC